ncbi:MULTISPECIES: class I adenylate-forming enzyme family protein [Arthrobacter]|nr:MULTISPECIES: class I adenylate-forming enzyme family protein [Arthrobacter]MBT8163494.1 acyl--CoA ligase [Arthrobacter sp. GN70]
MDARLERATVSDGKEVLTTEQLLKARCDATRNLEASGVGPRSRVGLVAPNSVGYVVVLLGLLELGAVPFLIDPAVSSQQLNTLIDSTGIEFVIQPADHDALARIEMRGAIEQGNLVVAATSSQQAAPEMHPLTEICRFTSGSTRTAACIEFTGRAVVNAARSWVMATEMSEADSILCFAGAYNGLAFNTSLIPALVSGASLSLPAALPSAGYVRRKLEHTRGTILVGFPAIYDALARTAKNIPGERPRLCLSSSARLAPSTREILGQREGIVISDYYGLAETGPLTEGEKRPDAVGQGKVLPNVSIRVEEGGLLVRSTSMGTRYLNYPGLFESRLTTDGYYRSGDEGTFIDGRLVLSGRSGKGLNVGGKKVSPDEIRDVLLESPNVTDAHVSLATSSSQHGILCALVKTQDTVENDLVRELRGLAERRLSAHERPMKYFLVDAIPRSGPGKPRLTEIDELIQQLLGMELQKLKGMKS